MDAEKHNALKKEYKKLSDRAYGLRRRLEKISREKDPHLLPSGCAAGMGLPWLCFGLYQTDVVNIILGTAFTTLAVAFGVPAFMKNRRLDNEEWEIRKELHFIEKREEEIATLLEREE